MANVLIATASWWEWLRFFVVRSSARTLLAILGILILLIPIVFAFIGAFDARFDASSFFFLCLLCTPVYFMARMILRSMSAASEAGLRRAIVEQLGRSERETGGDVLI